MADLQLTHTGAEIDSAVGKGVATDDYVVERGTSGIWTFKKWNSGDAECWLTAGYMTSGTPATMTANGALFESNVMTIGLPSGLFVATPNVSVDVQQGGGMWFKATGDTSKDNIVYEMVRTNSTKAAARMSVQCTGRWK